MLQKHRPWSDGHKVSYTPAHQGGIVEGWIGGDPTHLAASPTYDTWLPIKLVPHWTHPQACVSMSHNGETLASCPLYSQPCLSQVSLVMARSMNSWQQGDELVCHTFPHQTDDIVVDIIEHNGEILINGQKQVLNIPLGGAWGPNVMPQLGIPFPHIGAKGHKSAQVRMKSLPQQSLFAWVKSGNTKITHQGKSWILDDIEDTQHPYYRLHVRSV